ncbi:helix-turn-helix domain-containing protein [Goodfellowiella coeruleoviolacea]|uniref:Helix-turn-helix domain-containing protein n=1 Tax=Goodfellowiella coeruleoviolacea TaxID=334858 RepID=A0AAE3KF26_9PSEU|nr:helix-turn-helix transcriptional regulator [Goodfellowiella coeruleoviolacea]MCP2163999.1 Helix-turn-helix domain-containing protein [Goodfellowiella coeruleoviolacea]
MTDHVDSGFGARLRAIRQRRGLTQRQLACPGISTSYVSRLESGNRVPSPSVVAQLAEALGVTAAELLGTAAEDLGQDEALHWCEATLAVRDGDLDSAVDLLTELGRRHQDDLFAWSVRWTRAVLMSRGRDADELLTAVEELRAGWSPGPAVDALVELQRAHTLWRLGRPSEAVRSARLAADLVGQQASPARRRVRVRALVTLCTQLARSGRFTEAEQAIEELTRELDGLPQDQLAVSAWWVRAQVKERLGELTEAYRSIRHALDLLKDCSGGPAFRCRVRLAAVSIELRSSVPDLAAIARELDEVAAEASPATVLVGQVAELRAELALLQDDPDRCWALAEHALSLGVLDDEDELRCHLLRVRAADQADDQDRFGAARKSLAALLDRISPEVVDPLLWRDIARFALSRP